MKKFNFLLLLLLPTTIIAQNKGVAFYNASNLQEVLTKAKAENKFIFLDIYATWCGPCKKMDADVYTNDRVAEYVNTNFISTKVQIDKTDADTEEIKIWYPDAEYLVNTYKIDALPGFLIFSPDAKLLQSGKGYKSVTNFMDFMNKAIDPELNKVGLLKKYREGNVKPQDLLSIALLAKENNDESLGVEIARKYKKTWLDKQNPEKVLSKRILDFFSAFHPLMTVKDKLIQYMYFNPTISDLKIDNIGYAMRLTDYVITKDIIEPMIKRHGDTSKAPDWSRIHKKIEIIYDKSTANRLLRNSKLSWYNERKDWQMVVKYNIEKLEDQGLDTVGMGKMILNDMIYNVIAKHSDDPVALTKGLGYMELILKTDKNNDSWIDTYATLLYKLGRKEDAINHELEAIEIARRRHDSASTTEYESTLKKMKEDLPLW